MKATKLASIFAVTAVAAAVSTTTLAAEAVFSGEAGLSVKQTNPETGDKSSTNGSEGELNITVDTGVVYLKMDMDSVVTGVDDENELIRADSFVLDAAYVTQGAVQFGDFDDSLFDSVAYESSVEEAEDYTPGGYDLAVRYAVTPELKVAFELEEGGNGNGVVVAYGADLGVATLGASYKTYFDREDDETGFILGLTVPAGIATIYAHAYAGESTAKKDQGSTSFGIDLNLTDSLLIAAAANDDTEDDNQDNTEISAFYTAGDLTYYATVISFNEKQTTDTSFTKVGVKASF